MSSKRNNNGNLLHIIDVHIYKTVFIFLESRLQKTEKIVSFQSCRKTNIKLFNRSFLY